MKSLLILMVYIGIYITFLMAGMTALTRYEINKLSLQIWEVQQQLSNQIMEIDGSI